MRVWHVVNTNHSIINSIRHKYSSHAPFEARKLRCGQIAHLTEVQGWWWRLWLWVLPAPVAMLFLHYFTENNGWNSCSVSHIVCHPLWKSAIGFLGEPVLILSPSIKSGSIRCCHRKQILDLKGSCLILIWIPNRQLGRNFKEADFKSTPWKSFMTIRAVKHGVWPALEATPVTEESPGGPRTTWRPARVPLWARFIVGNSLLAKCSGTKSALQGCS